MAFLRAATPVNSQDKEILSSIRNKPVARHCAVTGADDLPYIFNQNTLGMPDRDRSRIAETFLNQRLFFAHQLRREHLTQKERNPAHRHLHCMHLIL
jgi:hypothetical protein